MVTDYKQIIELIDAFDPGSYGRTRNYADGNVSRLSPYISRGVISTRFVLERLRRNHTNIEPFEKFIQELVWRDHWQRNWQKLNIDNDILRVQDSVVHRGVPRSILDAKTGVDAIDQQISELMSNGYMHNHMRMYVASIVCNVGKYHWKEPAKWMYYHLLDGDWGSNALSWQWVAGTNSHKKYYANQENINKFFYSDQRGTFLDQSYEELVNVRIPDDLMEAVAFEYKTDLPETTAMNLSLDKPVILYTSYNLDPNWLQEMDANRILFFDTAHFQQYPVSPNVIRFIMELAKNIEGLQVVTGTYEDLQKKIQGLDVHLKEHPFSRNYKGIIHERDWIAPEVNAQTSFFKYWKKVQKSIY